jgi:hypothetical protein
MIHLIIVRTCVNVTMYPTHHNNKGKKLKAKQPGHVSSGRVFAKSSAEFLEPKRIDTDILNS